MISQEVVQRVTEQHKKHGHDCLCAECTKVEVDLFVEYWEEKLREEQTRRKIN